MSDSETDPLSSLLSSFALGPAWARAAGDKPERKPKAFPGGDDRPPRRDDRERGSNFGAGGGDRRRGGNYEDRRSAPVRPVEVLPEEGVRATVAPDPHAVHLIGKEVHQVARVYPLFDVAKILLAEKSRCRAIFEAPEPHAPLIKGKLEESVFLTRDEAVRHLWNSKLRDELIEEETIEVDPPTGNFQAIARCGISGEWLGPVNFHSYQTNLRRLHRERFAKMPFEIYAAKVRTERGEEAVNAWLETMKKKTRWRMKGDDDEAWIDDRAAAEKALGAKAFDKAFEESRNVEVSAAILPEMLSPGLFAALRSAGSHARNHPAILIPAVCRAVEAEHLPVFKRQGKLHTGPARPHPLPLNAILAERPGQMVNWIRENRPAKLEGLWKSVLPEGSTAPPAEYAADLFWLLHQGHILLFTDDTLVVQEARDTAAPEAGGEPKKSKKKKKNRKPKTENGELEAPAAAEKSGDPAAEAIPTGEETQNVTETSDSVPDHSGESNAEPAPEPDPPSSAPDDSQAIEETSGTAGVTRPEDSVEAENPTLAPEAPATTSEASEPAEIPRPDDSPDAFAKPETAPSLPENPPSAADESSPAPEEKPEAPIS